jgi:hypothetical protein
MKIPTVRLLFVIAAAVATVLSLFSGELWYLRVIAAAVFVIAAFLPLEGNDKRILLLASGELLVIAVADASFFTALVVQCAVIGAVLFDGTDFSGTRDLAIFSVWCIAALLVAIILDRSNQVLLPFLAITAGVVAVTGILIGLQEMRERRKFAGGT